MKKNTIDLGLTILCNLQARGQTLSVCEIAEVCECSRNYIFMLETNAIKKLQGRYSESDFYNVKTQQAPSHAD